MHQARSLLASLALVACSLTACTTTEGEPDSSVGVDGGVPDGAMSEDAAIEMDATPALDGGQDAAVDPDAGIGCGPDCPPGACFDGLCIEPGSCCDTDFCPRGLICMPDCTCGPLTGCCTGEPCPGTDLCDRDCTCFSADDCCRAFGCRTAGEICNADCSCEVDTSCGPTCTGDHYCDSGTCRPRCAFDGFCEDPALVCNPEMGCVEPLCTSTACALGEPPQTCDPLRGCGDPCAEGDWSWCTSMGGRCLLGQCVNDSCSGSGGVACHYRYDCWGNASCRRDDEPDPECSPFGMTDTPYQPPRPDLCVCGAFGGCVDTFGGGIIGPFPEPFPFSSPPPR